MPSSWTASVRGTLRPPSGTARCFAMYSRWSHAGVSHAGVSCAASASTPRASVSDRIFETDTSPSPSQESVSRASRNAPSRAPSRQTVPDAARVIFRLGRRRTCLHPIHAGQRRDRRKKGGGRQGLFPVSRELPALGASKTLDPRQGFSASPPQDFVVYSGAKGCVASRDRRTRRRASR